MTRIEVKAQLQNEVVTREHGAKLRELIEQRLGDPPVVLDFIGLQIASVSFFDEALGQLALRHGKEKLFECTVFENIDPFDLALVGDIVDARSREADKRAKRRTA